MIRAPIRGGSSGSGLALVPGATGVRLVAPAVVSPPLSFTRAQVSAFATAIGQDGASWAQYGANQPRFLAAAQSLVFEPQGTNGIRNPRGEGATPGVIGSGGAAPTNWSFASVGGLAWEVVGTGTDSGINYVRLRLAGTAANGTGVRTGFETAGVIAASVGQTWTHSHFVRLVSGSQNGLVWQPEVRESPAAVFTTASNVTFNTSWQRVSVTRTLTDGTTTSVLPQVRQNLVTSNVYDLVIDVGWPQVELGAIATSPILPPAASPAASTRGADAASCAASALFPNGIGSMVGWLSIAQAASGADQIFLQIDDGTDSNRIRLRNPAGGATLVAGVVNGGAATDAASAGTLTPGTRIRFCMTFGGGRQAILLDGGSVQAITGLPSGLVNFRLANNAANTAPLNGGTVGPLDAYPYIIPDAGMQSAINAV